MKKILSLLFFCNAAVATPLQDHRIDPIALKELLSVLHIEGDLVTATQKHWLRKPGKERWEMEELEADQRSFVLTWAEKQGFFIPWKPSCKIYHAALILGGTTSSMQRRLNYLKQLWDEGVRFQEIVWLTGERPLDDQIDTLVDRCSTEAEASRILWEETPLPDDMRRLPVTFIADEMKAEGTSLRRPNTKDTILTWMDTTPSARRVLFVSSQPVCYYQFTVIKTTLAKKFLFDLVGPGCDPTKHPAMGAVILDSLARQIYQENSL